MPNIKLHEMKKGERGKVASISGEITIRRRLADMGLVRGSSVEIQHVAPLGDPIEIRVKGYNLSLRKNEADVISIEVD